MTATFVRRVRRSIRETLHQIPPIRHHIAAAQRAKRTRRAHASGDAMRQYFRGAR